MTGVQIPRGQLTDPDDQGTPLTVGSAMLAFMAPVKWYDDQGRPHQEFVFVVGNNVYRDPGGEHWASRLKTFTDKVGSEIVARCQASFQDELRRALREMGITAGGQAAHDEVDVLADQTDKDVTPTTP